MIGDVAKWAILAQCRELAFSPRPTLNIHCDKLRYKDGGIDASENIRHCEAAVNVCCDIREKPNGEKVPVYKISSNIIDNRCLKENSYEAFLRLCEKNEVAEFVRKFFHIDKHVFERAHKHAGTQFYYGLDYDLYEAEVEKKNGKGTVYYNPFYVEDKED